MKTPARSSEILLLAGVFVRKFSGTGASLPEANFEVCVYQSGFFLFRFSLAVASISLIRFNWFTSLAPGS